MHNGKLGERVAMACSRVEGLLLELPDAFTTEAKRSADLLETRPAAVGHVEGAREVRRHVSPLERLPPAS